MVQSFIMMGQSNMAGRGRLDEVEPISDERLLMLRNGRWLRMTEPVSCDRTMAGACLGVGFAWEYVKSNPGVSVGLIPCADGGTSLKDWEEGGLLFDHAVCQAGLAGRTSEICGILWHQGESDCEISQALAYEDKFLKLMEAFKCRAGLWGVPVFMGGLGEYLADCKLDPNGRNYDVVNQQLRHIAEVHSGYYYVASDGLGCNEDFLHFHAAALREFGKRYYYVWDKRCSLVRACDMPGVGICKDDVTGQVLNRRRRN